MSLHAKPGDATAGDEKPAVAEPANLTRIDTKTVHGRRELAFRSLDEVVADARQLVEAPNARVIGNWPLERIIMHLAAAINGSIDGISVRAPWYMRMVARLFKGRILRTKMTPGFRVPEKFEKRFYPPVESPQAALEKLSKAVARLEHERMSAVHPAFGKLSHEEWTQMHLRHSELHLSFVVID